VKKKMHLTETGHRILLLHLNCLSDVGIAKYCFRIGPKY